MTHISQLFHLLLSQSSSNSYCLNEKCYQKNQFLYGKIQYVYNSSTFALNTINNEYEWIHQNQCCVHDIASQRFQSIFDRVFKLCKFHAIGIHFIIQHVHISLYRFNNVSLSS